MEISEDTIDQWIAGLLGEDRYLARCAELVSNRKANEDFLDRLRQYRAKPSRAKVRRKV